MSYRQVGRQNVIMNLIRWRQLFAVYLCWIIQIFIVSSLQTDASDCAVLSQIGEDDQEHSIAYFSRKLPPREVRYSTIEKECLLIKLGIEAFWVYLLGKEFVVQTDHRAHKLKDKNARLARWSLILQQYMFTGSHWAGSTNGNADVLSRASLEPAVRAQEKEGGVLQIVD